MLNFLNIFAYIYKFMLTHWPLIRTTIKHEFQAQYKKSILGPLWIIMNPLYMCIIYSAIFSSIMNISHGGQKPAFSYTIYVATGLITWNFFTDIITRSQQIYIDYSQIIKHQKFPLACLPFVVCAMASLDFLVSFGLFNIYLIATHSFPGLKFFALCPILIIQTIFALSIGTLLGLLNLFFRDVGRGLVIFLQLWFWLTPIVYFSNHLPQELQNILVLNPLTSIITIYHTIIAYQQWPTNAEWLTLVYPLIISLLMTALLFIFFHKHHTELLDEF